MDDLLKLIPDGIDDERARRMVQLLKRWDELRLENLLVYRWDRAGEDVLRQLAWQFHVMGYEGWALATTESQRRELVRRAMALHRRKGTPWAVKHALGALGLDAETVEWFQPDSDLAPFEFGVRAVITAPVSEGVLVDERTSELVSALIAEYKNVRSHLAWTAFSVRLDVTVPPARAAGRCAVRRSVRAPVEILPVFDRVAADARALDARPIGQRLAVRSRASAAVQLGGAMRMDRRFADGAAPDGAPLDVLLPYREGERVPPAELAWSRARISAAGRVRRASAGASRTARRSVSIASSVAASPRIATRSRAFAAVPPARRGHLDLYPRFDFVGADRVPLDTPMETVNA